MLLLLLINLCFIWWLPWGFFNLRMDFFNLKISFFLPQVRTSNRFFLDFENRLKYTYICLHLWRCLIFLCDFLYNPTAIFFRFKDRTKVKGGLYYALKQVTGNEGLKKGIEKTWEVGNSVCFTPKDRKEGLPPTSHPYKASFSQVKI